MIVHYKNTGGAGSEEAAMGKGVSRIDATGNVIFSNPTDTAKGDLAVYDVNAQTLDLTGNVLLTRDKNVLKGTRMNYNLTTGRSVLTAGNNPVAGATPSGNGRVHGLFVPGTEKK
jgi:lipopolysaccharide export system protein LptA